MTRGRLLAGPVALAVMAGLLVALPAEAQDEAPAGTDGDVTTAEVGELAEESDEPVDVIIQFDDTPSTSIEPVLELVAGDLGETKRYANIDSVTGSVTEDQLERLEETADALGIVQIELNAPIRAANDGANRWLGATAARTAAGVSGNGTTVAVIDTGIDVGHVDLDGGKVIAFNDFRGPCSGPQPPGAYDDDGHGSHVAATIAGAGDGNASLRGVAPGASIVAVKVLDCNGNGSSADLVAGLQWVIDQRNVYGIDVVNISIEGSACNAGTDPASRKVNDAAAVGLLVVVSAGNGGPGSCTITFPGSATGALTVGAVADPSLSSGFSLADFSGRGPTSDNRLKPELVAPGVSITSANAGTSAGYEPQSGTSMSAPMVAGTALLMKQRNQGLSASQLRQRLLESATDWGPAGPDNDFGHGLLNAFAAVSSAGSPLTDSETRPSHQVASVQVSAGATSKITFSIGPGSFPVAVTVTSPTADASVVLRRGGRVVDTATLSNRHAVVSASAVAGSYEVALTGLSGTPTGTAYVDVSGAVGLPGSAVTSLTGTTSATTVALNWVSGVDVTGFQLTQSPGPVRELGNVRSFSPPGLRPGTDYTFTLRPRNSFSLGSPRTVKVTTGNAAFGSTPIGALDKATAAAGGIFIGGWAFDGDNGRPVDLHVYDGASFLAAVRASKTRSDLPKVVPGIGSRRGFGAILPAGDGVHNICVFAISIGPGPNSLLGCRTVTIGGPPLGVLDRASTGAGTVTVSGWTIDGSSPTRSTAVHTYIDGQFAGATAASRNRPDIGAAFPGFGNQHGFLATYPISNGTHTLCSYAIDIGGSVNTLIGCRRFTYDGSPFGVIDSATRSGPTLTVAGWTADPDTPTRSPAVHVYVDGILQGVGVANFPRNDVAAAFPGFGAQHGYSVKIPVGPGPHTVCVFAIDTGGGVNPLLGCRSV